MDRPRQLDLPLAGKSELSTEPEQQKKNAPREPQSPRATPRLRVIEGEGKPRVEKLRSRNDLARVLVGAAGDMLLNRISAPRANEIERAVERLLALFDRVDREPLLEPVLRRELDALEALVREQKRPARR